MSSSNYTRMENTIVSGSSLLSNLMQGYDYMDLQFQASLNRNPIIDLTATNKLLTAADCVQAVVSTQLVNASSGPVHYLYTGTDSASQAASYINLFDLASGLGSKVLLHFQLATNESNDIVYFGATGSTNTNCYTLLSGTSTGPTNIMFAGPSSTGAANVGTAGAIATVECYALNVTEGSEVVIFNILGLVSNS